MRDVITIGAATRDVFIKSAAFEVHSGNHGAENEEGCFPLGAKIEIDDLVFETGGGATNAAVTFGRLGLRTATVGAVGSDGSGRDVLDALRREGVATAFVQKLPKFQTAYSLICVASTGERTILVYRGASQKIDREKIPWRKLKAKWFYVSSVGGDLKLMAALLDHAEKIGARVAWNPGGKELDLGLAKLASLIKKTDVFNLNREEAAKLAGADDLQKIRETLGPIPRRLLVVTDGLNGAYAASKNESLHSGIIAGPRVNTTGAGDAFGSGVVAALLKQDNIREALAVGTLNATGVVQHMGAKLGILKKYPSPTALAQVPIEPWK